MLRNSCRLLFGYELDIEDFICNVKDLSAGTKIADVDIRESLKDTEVF